MKINKYDLKTVLDEVTPGTGKTTPQSECFLFYSNRITTYNDQLSITMPFDIGITGAVDAKKFMAIIDRMQTGNLDTIDLDLKDGTLYIKGKNAKAQIQFNPEIQIPIQDEINTDIDFRIIPEKFKDCLYMMIQSADAKSNDAKSFIYFKDCVARGFDGRCYTKYTFSENPTDDGLFGAIHVNQISKILKYELYEYAIDDTWVHFKTPHGSIISCRYLGVDFIETFGNDEIDEYLKYEGTVIVFPEGIDSAIKNSSIFSQADGMERIRIILSDNRLYVTSKDNTGIYEEVIQMGNSQEIKEEIVFEICPIHFMNILQYTRTGIIGEYSVNDLIRFEGPNFGHFITIDMGMSDE